MKDETPEVLQVSFEFAFIEGVKSFWVDVRKMLRKLKRRKLFLRRYRRRGERMKK